MIYILRSTEIINDSRTLKLYNELKYLKEVKVVGWNREGIKLINSPNFSLIEVKSGYGLGLKNIFDFIRFEVSLFKILFKHRKEIDIIHSCDLDTGIITFLFCKLFNKKYNYDIFDFYAEAHKLPVILNKFITKLEYLVINNAENTILCTYERIKQIAGANPKNIEVIFNTPDLSEINHSFKLQHYSNKKKLCYVGVLQENRLLKEIFNTISAHKDIELHIGGFGILESDIPHLDNIFFYGKMEYADVLGLEEKCDILFATYNPDIKNHKYSAPNKIYESCALGKPIIVCKNTGIDEFVIKNKIGKSISYDIIEFWKTIDILCQDDYDENKIKEVYDVNFAWENMRNIIRKLYNESI